jgi:CRP-like cAMP-binding protein
VSNRPTTSENYAPLCGIQRSPTARATQATRVVGLTVAEFRRRFRGEKLSHLTGQIA